MRTPKTLTRYQEIHDCVSIFVSKAELVDKVCFWLLWEDLRESQVGAAAAASAHGPESPGGAVRLPSNTSILTAKLGC